MPGHIDLSTADGEVLVVSADGSLLTGSATRDIELTTSDGAATLSASGLTTVKGAGTIIESVSATVPLTLTTAPLVGNTSGVRISTGQATAYAGSVTIEAGDGGSSGAGGSITMRPGGGDGSHGNIELQSDSGDAMVRAGKSGGVQLGGAGASGVSKLRFRSKPLTLTAGSSTIEINGTFGTEGNSVYALTTTLDIGAHLAFSNCDDGSMLTLINTPSSTGSITIPAAYMGTGSNMTLAKGTMAVFLTWGCDAEGEACLLLPSA